jgi:hypothetical protein
VDSDRKIKSPVFTNKVGETVCLRPSLAEGPILLHVEGEAAVKAVAEEARASTRFKLRERRKLLPRVRNSVTQSSSLSQSVKATWATATNLAIGHSK